MSLPQPEVLWDHLRRHFGDKHEISVEALLASLGAEKHVVDRSEVVAQFQDWDRRKLGSFTVGRRRHRSRIWLHKTPKETVAFPSAPTAPPIPSVPTRKAELPLTQGRVATFEFPIDLASADVEKMARFLRFYVSGAGVQNPAEA